MGVKREEEKPKVVQRRWDKHWNYLNPDWSEAFKGFSNFQTAKEWEKWRAIKEKKTHTSRSCVYLLLRLIDTEQKHQLG